MFFFILTETKTDVQIPVWNDTPSKTVFPPRHKSNLQICSNLNKIVLASKLLVRCVLHVFVLIKNLKKNYER